MQSEISGEQRSVEITSCFETGSLLSRKRHVEIKESILLLWKSRQECQTQHNRVHSKWDRLGVEDASSEQEYR